MKKFLLAIALTAVASTAQAVIANGSHDMSQYGGTLSACWYCHAPHNTNTAIPGAPLWNRSAGAAVTVYTSGTLTQTAALGANSITCLSCHDGVTDLGTMFVGTSQVLGNINTAVNSGAFASVGTDLTNDHPVGVIYTAGGTFNTVANVVAAGLELYQYSVGVYSVECGSCHDPHGTWDQATGGLGFLRAAPAAMCTGCHSGK